MIDLKDMLKAGIHFGHKSSRWSPKMRPFIWGEKNKIHLINVAKTAFLMERVGKYLNNLAADGKSVLWVGTKKPAQSIIKQASIETKMPFVINRWIGGTLTNFNQIKKAITRLLHLRDILKKPSALYKKKELSMIQKEVERLEKNIGGIIDLDFPPAAVIVVDAKKENSAVKEAISANIPVVAMVDTNTDPTGINFIIPANDDSPRSIEFVIHYLSSCIQDGKKLYNETKKEELTRSKTVQETSNNNTIEQKKIDTKIKAKTKTLPSTPTEKTAKNATKVSLKEEIDKEKKESKEEIEKVKKNASSSVTKKITPKKSEDNKKTNTTKKTVSKKNK
ncbi:30S ribosomal protein S2 [Candidatus Dependentiae bacterium]|nr:30S ribosomal protein S2 [Candidatus Dependentiae bacterium]